MKSKTSFFSVSPAVIKEDFRRFWAIPVLAFIGYFLFGILPIITDYDLLSAGDPDYIWPIASTVQTLLDGQNPFIILNTIWIPLLSGILIFGYLHRTGSVMSVHSQPVTRNMLFNSHYLSAFLFGVIPVVLSGLILMILSQPIWRAATGDIVTEIQYVNETAMAMTSSGTMEEVVNLFSRVTILQWMWDNCLIIFFILAITAFGGMITGTSVHHFIAAAGFNAVAPACYLLMKYYYQFYLFGYNEYNYDSVLCLSPVLKSADSGPIGLLWSVIFLAVALAITALTMFLYNKRKLERAGDGVVFRFADVLITLLFGFLGMSLLGFTFESIFRDHAFSMMIVGHIVGALLAMAIVRMIIMKSFRIFNLSLFRMVLVYAAASAVFFSVLVFDLTGFESRVPDPEKIDTVYIQDYYAEREEYTVVNNYLSDPETIELVTKLHEEITENKTLCEDYEGSFTEGFEITYYTGSREEGTLDEKLSRRYHIPEYFLLDSENYKALIECDEYKKLREEKLSIDPANILSGQIEISDRIRSYYEETGSYYEPAASHDRIVTDAVQLTKEETAELLEIFRKEFLSYSAEERFERTYTATYVTFSVYHNVPAAPSDRPSSSTSPASKTYLIHISDQASIEWLRSKGILNEIESGKSESWTCAVLSTIDGPPQNRMPAAIENEPDRIPAADANTVVITDREQMLTLYRSILAYDVIGSMDVEAGEYNDYCWLTFISPDRNDADALEYEWGLIRRSDIPAGVTAPEAGE